MSAADQTQKERPQKPALQPYLVAVLLVALATVLSFGIKPLFGGRVPLTGFTLAVILGASYGGLGPGLLATFVSIGIVRLVFQHANFSLLLAQPSLATFGFVGVAISLIVHQLRRSNVALVRAKNELELANHQLSKRTEALSRSNEELQRFAYALSHDLQTPLRTAGIFTERLALHQEAHMDEGARASMRFIIEAIGRMQAMIQGLLEYSTASHDGEDQKAVTDCNTLVQLVIADLHNSIAESGAVITCDPLPMVDAIEERLRQVFLNIIANALKYRADRRPEIHISAKRMGNDWAFSIQDNGIGIAMEDAEKIFGVFQRLHTAREYEGSGIGLAVCRAIIERHGGRLWVESELGQGSTFFFSLPA